MQGLQLDMTVVQKLTHGVSKMCGLTKLWVDDTRPIPENLFKTGEWTRAYTAWEALFKLEVMEFDEVSLDHDIASFVGNKELTGYDILIWLVERKLNNQHVPSIVRIHTANPVGASKMHSVVNQHFGGSDGRQHKKVSSGSVQMCASGNTQQSRG